ncbi:MAG: nucleoside hydrolase [Ginsengibacter sp.]
MAPRNFIFIFFLFLTLFAHAQKKKSVSIIFDSDIGPDYDDVGAITVLHVLADQGKAKILATIASNKYEGVAAVLNVFNTYFNRPNIPIGVPKGNAVDLKDSQHWTDSILLKYPHSIKYNNQVPDAIEVYRKVLSSQPDHSVTIVSVGFFTNLANLLRSPADQFSKLSGKELIKEKVKLLVSMGGWFPSGKEFNISQDAASSKYALEHWPTPVIFSGFNIGKNIKTGLSLIHNKDINNSPVKDVFSISIPMASEDSAGRMSWDETAVLVAIKGYKPYFYLRPGKIHIKDDGNNTWEHGNLGQYYLIQKSNPQKVAKEINHLIMVPPKK